MNMEEIKTQNLRIGLQKTSREKIVKEGTEFEGIEKYLYIKIGINEGMKLDKKMLEYMMEGEKEAWRIGEKNTFEETEITTMREIMKEIGDDRIGKLPSGDEIYVITNKQRMNGASAVLDKQALGRLKKECGTDRFIVLPSSIHEMLLIEERGKLGAISELSKIVCEVNEAMVEKEERLSDRAYVMYLE